MRGSSLTAGIRTLAGRLCSISERVVPRPFLVALVLTYLVFVGGMVVQGASPLAMLGYWHDGFWGLLRFGMQMVLIIATGFVLVYHPRIQRAIQRLSEIPSDGRQAVVLVGLVSMVSAWFHWGFGLIVGAVLAREMGKYAEQHGLDVHYPLLGFAGFMGLGLTWHLGLSGSAPLIMNTQKNIFVGLGLVDGVVPPSETIFHPYAIILLLGSMGAGLLVLYLVSPRGEAVRGIGEYLSENELSRSVHVADGGHPGGDSAQSGILADRLDESRVIGGLIALGGVVLTVYIFATRGLGALTFNVINFGLLFVGLALYLEPRAYQEEFYESMTATAGIVLQFPFYAGIIGMMNQSGLTSTIASVFLSQSTATTFPLVAWLTAAFVNLFVPSGGAEWNVIGQAILSNANALGVPPGQAVIAYSLGDAFGNLVQPFWMIPLLGITGLKAREIFGYALTVLVLLAPILAGLLLLIPY